MVDHIRQAIYVVIPCLHGLDGSDDEEEKIVDISGYGSNARPLHLIKRKEDIEQIRKRLSAKNRVLLRAFSTNAYYSCDIAEMQQKVLQHMTTILRVWVWVSVRRKRTHTHPYQPRQMLTDRKSNYKTITILRQLKMRGLICYRFFIIFTSSFSKDGRLIIANR
jgi:hypothetical protein